jgi:hypothetical protein
MTISNGTVMAIDVFLAVGPGSQGTLTLAGGTLELSDALGDESVEGTGTVWMTGGTLITPEIDLSAQEPGVMEMTISNGTLSISTQDDGLLYIQDGTLTVAGGSSTMALLYIYQGTVWVSGGQLNATLFQNPIYVYSGIFIGDAQMIVSNGTTTASSMRVGDEVDSSGTFTVAGGVSSVFSNLTIGFGCGSTGTGTVIITGGSLFVTNAAHNAVLDLENGTLTLSGGTLVADILVKTNPCAFFQQTGGTLVVGGVTNPSSLFSITAISRAGNNMAISWQTPGGVTNIVQATNGGPGGSYNTNFVDLSPQFIIPSGSPITTNYLDVGGATNIPSRYYRVRLVP